MKKAVLEHAVLAFSLAYLTLRVTDSILNGVNGFSRSTAILMDRECSTVVELPEGTGAKTVQYVVVCSRAEESMRRECVSIEIPELEARGSAGTISFFSDVASTSVFLCAEDKAPASLMSLLRLQHARLSEER
jgi:hypothetical protein